jgi:arylsulfatase A-like enzyme
VSSGPAILAPVNRAVRRSNVATHRAAALVVALIVSVMACERGSERSPLNLILISLDTLRADRLSSYGYERDTSPAIDALAARGVRFQTVVAESSWTLPSHTSLFTGRSPTSHGVVHAKSAVPDEIPLLAEVLARAGYESYAHTAGGHVAARKGFDRGFIAYDDDKQDFRSVLAKSLQRIDERDPDRPLFLFIHTYDIHCPYDPPRQYASQFATDTPGSRPENRVDTHKNCGNKGPDPYNERKLTQGNARYLSDLYDAGIRWADDALGEFVAALESRGMMDDTVVVLFSDHGEELLEHGQVGHERTLYIESLLVPLVIAAPGVDPAVVEMPVGLSDVMPTLLELLQIDAPDGMTGNSLVETLRGNPFAGNARPLYSNLDRHLKLRSIVSGRHHLIVDEGETLRLFDWRADRREQTDLSRENADAARSLARELEAYHAGLPRPEAKARIEMSRKDEARLRQLGYVE